VTNDETWIIANRDGTPITVQIETENGWEDMIYYSNWEAAQSVLNIIPSEEVRKHGAHLKKIILS